MLLLLERKLSTVEPLNNRHFGTKVCQPYLESYACKLLGWSPQRKFFFLDAQICYFWCIFTISMKIYCTLHSKVQAAQNADLNFFTINGPAKTGATRLLSPALPVGTKILCPYFRCFRISESPLGEVPLY